MALKTENVKTADVYVKDEGDFATVIFQTPKAQKIAKESVQGDLYGKELLKVDVDTTFVSKFLTWAVSHNLSFESEIPVIIGSKFAITDKEAIRKAICAPKSMPDSALPKILEHVGLATFRGDTLDKVNPAWSVNDKFVVGQRYPVYDNEGYFVVGNDGKGYKMTPKAWSGKW
jgi:hypothetical protein